MEAQTISQALQAYINEYQAGPPQRTLTKLAEESDVDRTILSWIINQEYVPLWRTIKDIVHAIGLSPEQKAQLDILYKRYKREPPCERMTEEHPAIKRSHDGEERHSGSLLCSAEVRSRLQEIQDGRASLIPRRSPDEGQRQPVKEGWWK